MAGPELVSFTWRMRQAGTWRTYATQMPASVASRIGVILLREFAESRTPWTPADLDVTGKTRRFTFQGDTFILRLRLLDK
jgi:hypothetical protein